MELRKKPIPAPIARATTSRPVVPTMLRRSLPTVAALLTATAALACQKESPIEADPEPHRVVEVVKYMPSALPSTVTSPPPPQPGMGALELAAEVPPPAPPKAPPPAKHPPMVKGGMKHVVPTPKAPKLGGDIAAVSPI